MYLGSRYEQEAGSQQQALQRGLRVAKLDTVQVQYRLPVRQDQSVQGQDLEHLQRRHQRAAALLYYVAYWKQNVAAEIYLV